MNWLQRIINLVAPAQVRSAGPLAAKSAGMLVNTETALSHPTVWGCVRAINGAIAPLEWCEMQKKKDRTNDEIDTNVSWLLNKQANPEMTAFTWRELALTHSLLMGNHYSEIERDNMGRPIWLWPLRPEYVQPDRDDDGSLIYKVWGQTGGQSILPAANVFHLKGMGWDGIVGYSVITMARRTIGSGLAQDEYGANFFANGAQLGLVFEHPGKLSEDAKERFKKGINERTGPGQAFKAIVTEEGMKTNQTVMSMLDADFKALKGATAIDVCKWFGVPPHKVAELDRSTNNNIEHQSIEFVQDAIVPWCRRLEQEADIKLYGRVAQRTVYTKLDTDPLLRGDIKSMYEAYSKALGGSAFLCADDVRDFMQMNPLPDGKGQIFLQPLNYVEAGTPPAADPNADPAADHAADPATNVIRREALIWARKQKEQRNG